MTSFSTLVSSYQSLDFKSKIKGLAIDSRQVKPGYLFFAYPGLQGDGRNYIQDAIAKGASAIFIEQNDCTLSASDFNVPCVFISELRKHVSEIAAHFYQYPTKSLRMVGITGTNGKTSCSHFIAQSLHRLGITSGVMGTLGNGLYGELKETSLTTLDPVTMQKTLADILAKGGKAIAMEVSSHSLDQGRVNGIDFEVGVFTNLTQDHLDYHLTMENYARAKRKLFDQVRSAVINADDAFGQQLIATLPLKNLFSYGIENNAHVYAENIQLELTGVQATIHSPWGVGSVHVPLIGKFNLSNVLATMTTLCAMGLPFDSVLDSLHYLSPVPGRMQILGGKDKPLVVIDYSHTPDSLEKALRALRAHCQGKLICLFGCGGDRDRTKRPIMAKIAEQYADHIIVTDDNPRTEEPAQIVSDILQGFNEPSNINVEHDRSKAIQNAIHLARSGDCVLIAGKGAETYQQIGTENFPFSDVQQASSVLQLL